MSVVAFRFEKAYNAEVKTNAKEEIMMANKKKNTIINEYDTTSKPLFTGNYIHDNSVTEFEKAAEALNAIFNVVVKKREKKIKTAFLEDKNL